MDIRGIEGDINNYDEVKAATRQLFQLQMNDGHRYYRDGSTEEKRGVGAPKDGPRLHLSANELVYECLGIVLQNAVYLLCQCVGTRGKLVDDLSRNISLDSLGDRKPAVLEMIKIIQSINDTLKGFEVEKIRLKKENGFLTREMIEQALYDYIVDEDDVIYVINNMPPKYFLRWVAHSVNVNILPFKHEMNKLIEGLS